MRHDTVAELVAKHIPENAYAEQWDAAGLRERLREAVAIDFPVDEWAKEEGIADEEIKERVTTTVDNFYGQKREKYGAEVMNQVEKSVLLRTLDRLWREHIITIDHLRQVIYLRSYGQRDPLNEYKTEAFNLFQGLVNRLERTGHLAADARRNPVSAAGEDDDMLPDEDELPDMEAFHIDATTGENDVGEGMPRAGARQNPPAKGSAKPAAKAPKFNPKKPETWGKVGRNDMCPCGSGKRYKHCHGAYV